ncbi:hypothetical protein AN5636.2 [Aspergillus nidulans FGSC A4]|nr:hypothetical protein AN5636.2 [Aspergillus nidulans FGSC A4]|eukprot:XP_663240.1 hypothetical protein AN5636.2 [Aspergillus nidulans FGSC A4]
MWKISINFILLHWLAVFYPYGNVSAIDSYFFGVSSSTESGLNPYANLGLYIWVVDLKDLKTYQQLFLYFIPIVSNLGFINILIVVIRLHWFEKRLKEIAPSVLRQRPEVSAIKTTQFDQEAQSVSNAEPTKPAGNQGVQENKASEKVRETSIQAGASTKGSLEESQPAVSFSYTSKALYIPPPRDRDRGCPIIEIDHTPNKDDSANDTDIAVGDVRARRRLSDASIHQVGVLTFAQTSRKHRDTGTAVSLSKDMSLPGLSSQATLGRNSQFLNLTTRDREHLGGVEYRSLRLLLKIAIGMEFQIGARSAFYSAQTMSNNLGLTLTPDSMVSFQEATFPLFVMSFLAYAGNTLYPCFLRLVIWTMFKLVPGESSLREPLNFLLKYPRRCYVLLFRSRPTWALAGIIFILNFVDILLILLLDLDNPAVNSVPAGPRVIAAIFQAASARHTGTASFSLADVNPAVQFSLLVMMYIAVYPIAITVRASNTYEEKSLGIYSPEPETDENGKGYILTHMRNQLSFDLWYIFLGIFCICVAESKRIMNPAEPGFSVFAIFFEAVSAYGNVGLSLGYAGVSTSFSAQFSTFSKLVVCALMIRGRHRGMPSQLDRAVLLPSDRLVEDDSVTMYSSKGLWLEPRSLKVRRYHTR